MEELLARGEDINQKVYLEYDNEENVKRINFEKSGDMFHFTELNPLLSAIKRGHIDIVDCLLKHGANPNDETWMTSPMQMAIEMNRLDILKSLIEGGADLNRSCGWEDKTLVTIACERGNEEMVECLLQHIARIRSKS